MPTKNKKAKKAAKKVAGKTVKKAPKPAKLTKENKVKEQGADPCDKLIYETPGLRVTAKDFRSGVLIHHAYSDHASSIFIAGAKLQQVSNGIFKVID